MEHQSEIKTNWYCLQLLETFKEQSLVFAKLLDHSANEKRRQVFPLILGIKNTTHAIELLRQDWLLNEANVLTRLLIERLINLCFLVSAEPSDIESNKNENTTPQLEIDSAQDFIAAAKKFRFRETYDTDALEKKIATLESQSKVRINKFRVAIASYYTQASVAMSGSTFGAVCHLKMGNVKNLDEHLHGEFATLFYSCSSLIYEATVVVASKWQLSDIVSESEKTFEKAENLLSRMLKAEKSPNTVGYWKKLEDIEYLAKKHFDDKLNPYNKAFKLCAEAGVHLPHLVQGNDGSLPLGLSALFLKRILNDLRGVWLLLNCGYTSQAASIAASLFENTLLIKCIASNKERALKLKNNLSGKLPWKIDEMCKIISKDEKARGEPTLPIEDDWKLLYGQYAWLCEIKHPTLQQASHDAGATAYGKSYGIMAMPDVRENDMGSKQMICFIVLFASHSALDAFARGAGVKNESDNEKIFAERMLEINQILSSQAKANPSLKGLPFGLQDTKWGKKNLRPLACLKH